MWSVESKKKGWKQDNLVLLSFSGKKMLIICLVNKLNGKNLKHRDN